MEVVLTAHLQCSTDVVFLRVRTYDVYASLRHVLLSFDFLLDGLELGLLHLELRL